MASSFAQVMADAKALSFEERERLIAGLLEDDETPLSDEWAAELERRSQEVANGAKTYPAEEVFAELHRELEERRSSSSSTRLSQTGENHLSS